MLGYSPAHDIYLDAEHGSINEYQCEEMIRAADAQDKPVVIRVPTNQDHVILRYLDIGASGLIIPHVSSPDDAARAVAAMKFGPEGHRSFGGGRASAFGVRESSVDYMRRANRETVMIGLFEDILGLPRVKDILAVEGLDALIVGPNDLASSMGLPGQPGHPEVQAVADEVIAAARAAGKPTGLPASTSAQAAQHIARGCRFISLSVSALLIDGMNQFAQVLG